MKKIMIVEDDTALSNGIELALKQKDFSFIKCGTLKSARQAFSESVSLIILDINLPDGNGLDFCKEIRGYSSVPIVMLTANDLETDVIKGLEYGADDYITKPFSLMILRARVNTQLRRISEKSSAFVIDDFIFDFDNMIFSKKGIRTELSKTEQKLLKTLIDNKGLTLSREKLIDRIWTDGAEYVDENALSVTIKRLRDKLEDNPAKPNYIKTVYGLGYKWSVNSDG